MLAYFKDGHEFEQTPGDSGGQRARQAAVHGAAKSCVCVTQRQKATTETTCKEDEKKLTHDGLFALCLDHKWLLLTSDTLHDVKFAQC